MTFEKYAASTRLKVQKWWGEIRLCLRSRIMDSCLSHSAKGLDGKCKHHYHFQKTAITTLSLGNVDKYSCQAKTRQTILPLLLTDYIHVTLIWPTSCYWISSDLFKCDVTSEEPKGCLHNNCIDVHWSGNVLPLNLKWWQLTNMMWQQCKIREIDSYYFINSHICHITWEYLYWETVFMNIMRTSCFLRLLV